jgi:hypothetical protein
MVFMAEAIPASPQEVYKRSITIEADFVNGAAFDLMAYPPPPRRS